MPFFASSLDNGPRGRLMLLDTPFWNQGIEGIDNGPVPSSWHDCLVAVVVVDDDVVVLAN
jgi:hypothetical protein